MQIFRSYFPRTLEYFATCQPGRWKVLTDFENSRLFISHSPFHFQRIKTRALYVDPTLVDHSHTDPTIRIYSPLYVLLRVSVHGIQRSRSLMKANLMVSMSPPPTLFHFLPNWENLQVLKAAAFNIFPVIPTVGSQIVLSLLRFGTLS
jgi:hypothetical protein